MNTLEGDITTQNAEMYEASIKAIEHINELNKLTNDCLNDLLHMYANIGLGLCGIPGSVLSIAMTPYEFTSSELKYLAIIPGSVNAIQMIISGQFMIFSVQVATIASTNVEVENANRISQKVGDIGKRSYKITNNIGDDINNQVSLMSVSYKEYDEIASKSIEETERMNELVVELTDQNNRIVEYIQDYNNQMNELIAELNLMIVEEMET